MRTRRSPTQKRPPTVIDLFAGCGGLSLGLELAGFEPVFVNELNRDAMGTYLLNRMRRHPGLAGKGNHAYDIYDLTGAPGELDAFSTRMASEHAGGIDLVVGGPPCQGYSGIGHRRTFTGLAKAEIPSNHLFQEMVRVVAVVRPKIFLFENVRGLMNGRWTPDGEKGEIWTDVQNAFRAIPGYTVRSQLVFAKDYGVPQNRPRILLAGVRDDIGWTPEAGKVADGLLPQPAGAAPDPAEFLGDLVDPGYAEKSETERYPGEPLNDAQRWFRTDPAERIARMGDPLTEHEYSHHEPRIVEKFRYMMENGGEIHPDHQTKKFAQRWIRPEWGAGGPSITATSLPDDYVHFSQPRTFTVREWARFQTFPDWYQFVGKRTTGGRRRAGDPDAGDWTREVPKYTQIGNAVPVWLARAVGEHFRAILRG